MATSPKIGTIGMLMWLPFVAACVEIPPPPAAAVDATIDVATDAPEDVGDTGPDVPRDAAEDVNDTSADTPGPDTGEDADADVIEDTAPDVEPDLPDDWWDRGWSRRLEMTLSHTGTETHEDFVALVVLDSSYFDYEDARGPDLRFVVGDEVLAHEFDKLDIGGVTTVWVKIPVLAPGETTVFLYYGNPEAPSAQDPSAVWRAWTAVYHLDDDPAAAAPQLDDSANENHGTVAESMTSDAIVDGVIGDATRFVDESDGYTVPHDNQLAMLPNATRTFSAWFRSEVTDESRMMFVKESRCKGWFVSFFSDNQLWTRLSTDPRDGGTPNHCTNSLSQQNHADNGASWRDGDWHHLVLVYRRDQGMRTFYLDGQPRGTSTINGDNVADDGSVLWIGTDLGGESSFGGVLDEMRFSTTAPSPDRIRAWYRNQTGEMVTYRDASE